MKRLLSVLLVVVMVLGLSACAPKDNEGDTTTTTQNSTTTTTQSVSGSLNALTGENNLEGAGNRPVGIMVANDSTTHGKQAGIDKADLYVEIETEGSIPRLLAVFGNASRVPSKLGPVRSARSPFVNMARALGAVYVHFGGSKPALALLDTGVVDHINGLSAGSTFWRDDAMKNAMDYVHSVATSGEKMNEKIQKSKFSTTLSKQTPFTFGEKAGTITAEKVQVKNTASTTSSFVYDKAKGVYTKQYGKLENNNVHKSLEGNAVTVSNVLVLYAEKYVEKKEGKNTWYNFRNGAGTGYLISGGTAREIKFTRTDDSLTVTETDGTPAVFSTGKTYMFLADKTLSSNISFS